MPDAFESFAESLLGGLNQSPDETALGKAREKARNGDPWDLMKLQWPGCVYDEFQEYFINNVFREDVWGAFMKGSTGCGKGFITAQLICVWYDIWDDARIVLTSVTHDHCLKTLFMEVRRWFNRMSHRPPGLVGEQQIRGSENRFILPVNPSHDEGFSGKHGAHTLFVFDEASGVETSRFVMAENQAKKFVALSNPRTGLCQFRRCFPEDTPDENQVVPGLFGNNVCITIDGTKIMNVVNKCLSKPVGPHGGIIIEGVLYEQGQPIPKEVYEEHCKPIIPAQRCYDQVTGDLQSGDKRKIEWQVYARFPVEDLETQVIIPSWCKPHTDSWVASHHTIPVDSFGLDVAASDGDDDLTVLACGSHEGCRELLTRSGRDTMGTLSWVYKTIQQRYGFDLRRQGYIVVDYDGVGKGIADRMEEEGVEVFRAMGNSRPVAEEDEIRGTYKNQRAENYGEFARRISPDGDFDSLWPFPPEELLIQELCAPEKLYDSSGKYRITPKRPYPGLKNTETLKDKLGRSPDRADALVYLYLAVRLQECLAAPTLKRPLLMLSPEESVQFSKMEIDPKSPWAKSSWELLQEMEAKK